MTPDTLLEETKRVWSKHLGHPVTDDEARHILAAFQELFQLLRDIRADEKFAWDLRDISQGGDVLLDDPYTKDDK